MKREEIILLVEDNKADELLFKEALRELKVEYPVIVCTDGEEALDYLRAVKEEIFLLICDMNMPKMNGLELKRNIESHPEFKMKAIPFIFFSTSASQKEVTEAYDLGVQGYFNKALTLDELLKNLDIIVKYWERCRHPRNII